MIEGNLHFEPDLKGLSPADWVHQFRAMSNAHGFFERLGKNHMAGFIDWGDTLIVSFETLPRLRALTGGTPLGFEACHGYRWSALTIVARGDTWFLDDEVEEFFANLAEDGFFSDFKNVLFYGAGACGYAAARYSVAAPGARVLLLNPQSGLDPEHAGWDPRLSNVRARAIAAGAPQVRDALEAAGQAYVVYDPRQKYDAMHATVLKSERVMALPFAHGGGDLMSMLRDMRVLSPLLYAAGSDALTPVTFSRLIRARRKSLRYLRRVLKACDVQGRDRLGLLVRRHGAKLVAKR